ncbi:MAG: hypothetical protein AB7O59_12785 [Pirellulales bacterium]
MRSADLNAHQLQALQQKLAPIVDYLRRLRDRATRQQFPHDDRLFRLIDHADDAVQKLGLEIAAQIIEREVGQNLPRRPGA